MLKWKLVVMMTIALITSSASASLLSLNISGQFNHLSGIGGVAFGVNTPFTLSVVFDSELDNNPDDNEGDFDTTATLTIDGYGEYVFTPGTLDLEFYRLEDIHPDADSELVYSLKYRQGTDYFFFGAQYANPPLGFDPDSPTPGFFSNLSGTSASYPSGDILIPITFVGTTDVLFLSPPLFSLDEPMEITKVPLPPSVILLLSGLFALTGRTRRVQTD